MEQEENTPNMLDLIDGQVYMPAELADRSRFDRTTIVRMFFDEPGVIRKGHATTRKKRQYYTLRIPGYVAKRVFARMTVGAAGRAHL